MRLAEDFRRTAREALTGRWGKAVLAGFLAALLGAVESGGLQLNIQFNENDFQAGINFAGKNLIRFPELSAWVPGVLASVGIVSLAIAVGLFIVGSVVKVGYARFNLELLERPREPEVNLLVSWFPRWTAAAAAGFLKALYIFLWSLLLVIPGIVASYSYAMTEYILAEHPELTASEALARSKAMMRGNRWRLFCLQFSFIGWAILAVLTLGIGSLWLTPYAQAAGAEFYRDLSRQPENGFRPEE